MMIDGSRAAEGKEAGSVGDGEGSPARTPLPPRLSDLLLLLGVITAFSLFYFSLSSLRFTEFYDSNWDLGINMQAAWTSSHGYLAWNSGTYEFVGTGSFFFIHSTYVLLPASWLYSISPTANTLFALQAVVLASSAAPLYLIGRQSGADRRVVLVGVIVYLASIPILSGFLYDVHWEAFIPAEFLWTFYLWERSHYWWAIFPATLGFLTLEVFPALVIGIAAYFAAPYVRSFLTSPKKSRAEVWRTIVGPARPIIGLVLLAAVGYLVPSLVAHYLLPGIVGGSPIFPPSGPNTAFGVPYWGVSLATLGVRLLYWLILFASFGFIPLFLRRRLLILSVPWALYTVVMVPNPAYTTLGFQYSLVAVAPLAIGFVEGLGLMARAPSSGSRHGLLSVIWLLALLPLLIVALGDPSDLIRPTPTGEWLGCALALWVLAWYLVQRHVNRPQFSSGARRPRFRLSPHSTRGVARGALVAAVIVLVGSNIAISPLNPANFLGQGEASYSLSFSPSPSYRYMANLVDEIPAGSSILASDNLFPFVANNPNAYSLLWYPSTPPYLPFSAAHLPQYVLISTSEGFGIPPYINSVLLNESVYGIRNMLYSADYPGSIYLFQLGYSGPTHLVQVTPYPATTVLCGHDFAIGPSGVVIPETGTRCGTVVESSPASNLSGNNATIWYGPYSTLVPGNYTVTISLEGSLSGPGPTDAPILVMNANALGTGYWYYVVIQANEVSPTQWTNFTYHFELTSPHPNAEWRGYLAGPTVNGVFVPGSDRLNYIELDYTPPPN